MKNKQTETKFKSALRDAHLLTWVVCWGTLILVCASAPAQNLFVSSDAAGGNIYEFTANGVRSTFASALGLNGALAFDKAGNLFVADRGNIYKITPTGLRTTFASGLDGLTDLAFDSAGNLFVTTGVIPDFLPIKGSGKIHKLTPNGVQTTFADGLDYLTALAFDSAGNLFVANVINFNSDVIYKFTPAGGRTTFASGITNPEKVAFDKAGNLFVSAAIVGANTGVIYKITSGGVRSTFTFGVSISAPMACDSAGNLFVADLDSGNILKFTPSGVRSTFASGLAGYLAFQPPQTPTATLVNISARGSVETGEKVLIGGFIVSGSDSQQIIIRGLGPTLTQFKVSGVLADPFVSLLDGTGHVLYNNDNWKDTQQAAIQATGLAPPNDLESAILRTFQPGNYTAVLSGKNSTTGIGLLELYSTPSGLTNVSIRGFVGTGDNVLISGFSSSGGNGTIQLIIRALGPTLTQFGVSGALADPTLALLDSNGNVLASNDNWKNTQQSTIQATGFAPPNDLESAILATLPNGNYTALLAGKNGGTGVGLLEIYKLQ